MQNDSNILLQKLDEFIRRYYKNQLIKGSLYSAGILLAAFLSVTVLEYLAEFNSLIRGILFFSFLGAAVFVLVKYIAIPLLKLNKIGDRITYEQAAAIIGSHFSAVQDKLLNVLQLQNHQSIGASEELLLAGIRQKIDELRPIPFTAAIDLQQNKKYLPLVLLLSGITLLVAIVWPHVFSKSTTRLVHYQTYFEKEMPFHFSILNKKLEAIQTQDFDLNVFVDGTELPAEVYLLVNGIEYKLEKTDQSNFRYRFLNLQQTQQFQFSAAGFLSKPYTLEVVAKPTLLDFSMHLSYPAYLKKKDEVVSNAGDIQIPQGTKVTWLFQTRNTDKLSVFFSDSLVATKQNTENRFTYSKLLMRDERYAVKASNALVALGDSVQYAVHVLPDLYPQIEVFDKTDSINNKQVYFSGNIRDDYGFSQLKFIYNKLQIDSFGNKSELKGETVLSVSRDAISQNFYHFVDFTNFSLKAGEQIDYYFEVKDNDQVNGAKAARSRMFSHKAPTLAELEQQREKSNSQIEKDLQESISKAKQLQKDINDLSRKLNEKKQLNYEDQKKLEELLKKQQSLQSKIEQIKQENQQSNQQQNEFSQTDENILEKQQELEKLFENVMTPEMKKLFDELKQMMDKLDKNQVQEKLDELKLTNKDIEKELDRNLELFKQLEVQQKMQDAIDKLDNLQKKQEELSKESLGKKEEQKNEKPDSKKEEQNSDNNKQEKETPLKSPEDKKENQNTKSDKQPDAAALDKKQEELNKEFEELKKDIEELKEKNAQLEEPNTMPDTQKNAEQISKEMQNSSDQLKKGNKKSAGQSQKNASDKMQEMKEQMEQAMEEDQEEQAEEDAQALRQLLENLLQVSFSQEELLTNLPKTRVDDPLYVNIPKRQNKLKDDTRIIEDSLFALSKRVPSLAAVVNREVAQINANMDKTVKALAERNTSEGVMRMQKTMTSVNNLALMLSEALDQMQNQQKQNKESKSKKSGKCKKPGSGSGQKPSNKGSSTTNIRKMQEQLNKQLQEMKEAMEKGQKPGEKPGDKKGEKPGMGSKGSNGNSMTGSSEQFAKMAAQQEALRRQMQSMMEKLKNQGKNPGGNLASLMEETEKDLVNKRLTNETLKRQQEILTRLLESEKAEQEREQDEQRKSREAKNENLGNPERFLEYKKLKEKEMELLNTVPPGLNPFYKEKVNQYFNSVKQ